MSTIADLSDAVKLRVAGQRLIELTNESGTALTIDADVLNSACADAIGDFERITGIAWDHTNYSHMSVLCAGVVYFLEDYKSRDNTIMSARGKRFYAACEAMRNRVYTAASTNSTLLPSAERSNALPDFDRKKSVWKYGSTTASPQQTSTFGEDT